MTVETLAADYAATRARMAVITAKIAALRAEAAGPGARYDELARRMALGEEASDDEWREVEQEIGAITRRLQRYERALHHLAVDAGKLAVAALPFAALVQEAAGSA